MTPRAQWPVLSGRVAHPLTQISGRAHRAELA